MATWVADIESDGLLDTATKIHCICLKELGKESWHEFTSVNEFRRFIREGGVTELVGHNFVGYDLLLLTIIGGVPHNIGPDTLDGMPVHIVDTLDLSRRLNPDQEEHGLEWWGNKLGIQKIAIDDWSSLGERAYIERCKQDVRITEAVYVRLAGTGQEN